MSQGDSCDNSSESSAAFSYIPLCIVCEEAAYGVGPFSRHHLCHQHLAVDVTDGKKLMRDVTEQLRPYSECLNARVAALLEEQQELSRKVGQIEGIFAALFESLIECKVRVVEKLKARQEAVATCLRDFEDVSCYSREVGEAEAAGDMAEVCNLALSMQLSMPDLQADFNLAARVRAESQADLERSLRGQLKLQQIVADWWVDNGVFKTDAGVTAHPETSDTGVKAMGIFFSHEVKLNDWVRCVSVCSDAREFRADATGRVVPADSAGTGAVALPEPCLLATVDGKDHLTVLSLDGSVRMRCHCSMLNWEDNIFGLHWDRHLVYLAQADAVTVMDLSGHVIRRIRANTGGLDSIGGVTGNAASVFVSGGNKIAAFSKATGQLRTLIRLTQLPLADLDSMAIHGDYLLVTDWKQDMVRKLCLNSQQVIATHPTQSAGLARFESPADVAIDRAGRVFVSEFRGHSVRMMAADDGSLLWTLGVPGESGSGDNKLDGPMGLAVVTGGPCEQLVVADAGNCRLLVLNLL